MHELYARDLYSFDDQHTENLDEGDLTRVTCIYKNNTAEEVTYGEMSFLIAFAIDRSEISTCVRRGMRSEE